MYRAPRKLRLRPETLRTLTQLELRAVAGGQLVTSEANDGYPCPGEYSWFCKP